MLNSPHTCSPDALLLDRYFLRFENNNPAIPIWCLTPNEGRVMHRFFDTSPISPQGRYLACLRLPQETHFPVAGDSAEVVIVDLQTGTETTVAKTSGWEPQMGANLNWGGEDLLFFNDVDRLNWKPYTVALNVKTGERNSFGRGLYHASPCGRYLAASSLEKMRRTQRGYGVVIPDELVPSHQGFPEDDGLWITDTYTKETRLALSLRSIWEHFGDEGLELTNGERGGAYGFHCKFSPTGERLIFTVRWTPNTHTSAWDTICDGMRFNVLTCRLDGSDLQNAVPANRWEQGGHHINWFPDGEWLSMNLGQPSGGKHLTLVKVRYDGTGHQPILEYPWGSGHPTVHPNGDILTDTYTDEKPLTDGDGSSLLRWIHVKEGKETRLAKFHTKQPVEDGAMRVDPHPAWDRTWRFVAFNAFEGGTRRVYLADLRAFTN